MTSKYKMELLSCLMAFVALPSVNSQVNTGTIVVLYYPREKIIIAADSLETIHKVDGSIEKNNRSCKISALGNKIVFTGTGVMGGLDNWNGPQQARLAYNQILEHKLDFSTHIAYDWANAIKALLAASYVKHKESLDRHFPDGLLGIGIFAGAGQNGELWVTKVNFYVGEGEVRYELAKMGFHDCAAVCAAGTPEIALEFARRTSRRAKKRAWIPPNGSPSDTFRIVKLVELSVTYDTSGTLGGPIDAVVIKSNGSVDWYRRKDECPQD